MDNSLRAALATAGARRYSMTNHVPPRNFAKEVKRLVNANPTLTESELGQRIPILLKAILEVTNLQLERVSIEWRPRYLQSEPIGAMLHGLQPGRPPEVVLKFGRNGPRAVLQLHLAQTEKGAPHARDALLCIHGLVDQKSLRPYFCYAPGDTSNGPEDGELSSSMFALEQAVSWYKNKSFKRGEFIERLAKKFPSHFATAEKARNVVTYGFSYGWFSSERELAIDPTQVKAAIYKVSDKGRTALKKAKETQAAKLQPKKTVTPDMARDAVRVIFKSYGTTPTLQSVIRRTLVEQMKEKFPDEVVAAKGVSYAIRQNWLVRVREKLPPGASMSMDPLYQVTTAGNLVVSDLRN